MGTFGRGVTVSGRSGIARRWHCASGRGARRAAWQPAPERGGSGRGTGPDARGYGRRLPGLLLPDHAQTGEAGAGTEAMDGHLDGRPRYAGVDDPPRQRVLDREARLDGVHGRDGEWNAV